MRVIADCGSTSCKWLLEEGLIRFSGPGLNPTVMSDADLNRRLEENARLWTPEQTQSVTRVDFFGAGCRLASAKKKLLHGLKRLFPHAEIHIESDLMAACLAVYQGEPVAVGILGTGSAAAGFDGSEIFRTTPSLGYVLGDEGAGSSLGRKLLTAYLYNELPTDLKNAFETLFHGTTSESVLETFYGPQASGGKLAAYAEVAVQYPSHPFIQTLLRNTFDEFIQRHLLPLHKKGFLQAGLIGSVAFGFQTLLSEMLKEAGFSDVIFVQDPLDSLPRQIWKH